MKLWNARTGRTDADASRRRAEWPLAERVRELLGRVSPKTWVVLGTVAVTALARGRTDTLGDINAEA